VQYAFFVWVQLFHNLDICNPMPPHGVAFFSAMTGSGEGHHFQATHQQKHQTPVKVRLNKRYQHVEADLHALTTTIIAPVPSIDLPSPTRDQLYDLRSLLGAETLRGPPALS
jgi:hypothetical protein